MKRALVAALAAAMLLPTGGWAQTETDEPASDTTPWGIQAWFADAIESVLAAQVGLAATAEPVGPVKGTLTAKQLYNQIRKQKDKQIKKVKFSAIRREINALWREHGDTLTEWQIPFGYGATIEEKSYLFDLADRLREPLRDDYQFDEAWLDRVSGAGIVTNLFIRLHEWADTDGLRRRARRLADMAYDYGVTQVPHFGKVDRKLNRAQVNAELQWAFDSS